MNGREQVQKLLLTNATTRWPYRRGRFGEAELLVLLL